MKAEKSATTNTRGAALILGVPPGRLYRAVWDGRLAEPSRGPSDTFVWTYDDLRRAAWVLLGRDLDELGGGLEVRDG